MPAQRPRVPGHRVDERFTVGVSWRRHPRVAGQAQVRVHQAPSQAQDVRVAGAARHDHHAPHAARGGGAGDVRGRHAGAASKIRL